MFKDSWAFSPRFSRPTVCHHPPTAGNVPAEITQSRSTTIPSSLLLFFSLSHFHGIAQRVILRTTTALLSPCSEKPSRVISPRYFFFFFLPNLPSTSNLHNNSCVRLIMLDGLLGYLPYCFFILLCNFREILKVMELTL